MCKKVAMDGRNIPEFDGMSHFSALLNIKDIKLAMEANRICNETGMDAISAAASIACLYELSDDKIMVERIPYLLDDMAYSRREGGFLKMGSWRYSSIIDGGKSSMTVKGMELPAFDPRGSYGLALAYAVSTKGGCHLNAFPIAYEILGKPVDSPPLTFRGKARIVKRYEDINAVVDSLTACKFIFFGATLKEYAAMLNAATGMETTEAELMKTGEFIDYNYRIMNAINGFTVQQDVLPKRFFDEGGTGADGTVIKPIDHDEFLKARADYYKIRGLDKKGFPLEKKCDELGIDWNKIDEDMMKKSLVKRDSDEDYD
jgi:aldehyde:ferredoxin oxidoreductase